MCLRSQGGDGRFSTAHWPADLAELVNSRFVLIKTLDSGFWLLTAHEHTHIEYVHTHTHKCIKKGKLEILALLKPLIFFCPALLQNLFLIRGTGIGDGKTQQNSVLGYPLMQSVSIFSKTHA